MAFERRILTRYDASTAGFDRGTRRVEQQLTRLQRTADSRLSSIDQRFERAGRAALRLGTALGALGAGLGVAAIRNYSEAWRTAGRQLSAAGFEIDGNREKLSRLAVRVRGDFGATGQAVSRFARVTGANLDDSIRRVETLQKLLAVGGATTGEQASVALQLTQGLQSGQLAGDELRAIREAAPVELLDALARRAGGTRDQIKQLGADGKLTTDVIIGALDDLAATADQSFAKLAVSGSEAAEVLSTGFSTFFGRLDEQLGATAGLNDFLVSLGGLLNDDAEAAATFAKSLEVIAVTAGVVAGGRGLGAVNRALIQGGVARKAAVTQAEALVAATTLEVQKNRELVVARGQAFVAAQRNATSVAQLTRAKASLVAANNQLTASEVRAAQATNALAISQGRLSLATRVTTAALGTLRSAFAFFGGVPGLILGAVTAAVLLTDAFEDQADRLETLSSNLGDVESGIGRVRSLEQELASDTEALKRANERLTTAIEAQSGAAEDTARLEIDAINRRISKNQELRAEYEILLRAQLAIAEGQLAVERRAFNRSFGGAGLSRSEQIEASQPGGGAVLARTGVQERQQQAIAARRAAIIAAQDAGGRLSDSDREFLETSATLAELEIQARSTRDALEELGKPIPTTSGSGGGGGGGGRAGAVKEEVDALQKLIDSSDQRIFQLIDEIALEKAAAEDVAFLTEKQRLLNQAYEAGLQITPELLANIEGMAAHYASLTAELDRTRAAMEVIRSVEEAELTTSDRLVRSKERLLALLPEITEILGDEARAHEVVERAMREANEEILRDDPLNKLGEDLASLIATADSFEEALDRVLAKLIEIAAQELAAGLSGTGGGGIFGSLFSGIGGALGGLLRGSAAPTSSPIPIPRPVLHRGGVVGSSGPMRSVPDFVFSGAPRMHGGGIAGLGPNEIPAILERGEVVLPKNVGSARQAANITVGDTNISITEPGMTEAQLRRVLADHRRETIGEVIRMNDQDPGVLHT